MKAATWCVRLPSAPGSCRWLPGMDSTAIAVTEDRPPAPNSVIRTVLHWTAEVYSSLIMPTGQFARLTSVPERSLHTRATPRAQFREMGAWRSPQELVMLEGLQLTHHTTSTSPKPTVPQSGK